MIVYAFELLLAVHDFSDSMILLLMSYWKVIESALNSESQNISFKFRMSWLDAQESDSMVE